MRFLSSMDREYINQIEKRYPIYTSDYHTRSKSETPSGTSQKNNTQTDSDSKRPVERKPPVSSVPAADGNYPIGAGKYLDSMIQENVCIGDRSAEKIFVPTASSVTWTVAINERSDFKTKKPFEPISVFNDPRLPAAAKGNKSEHLFFSDSRNNRLFYSYQAAASENSKELTNYVEFHDLESDTHMLYETSVQAAVEGVLPEMNWLFGRRHHRPGESMMPIPVVSFFRMFDGGKLETIFQFNPYRQEDPAKEMTGSRPHNGSGRMFRFVEKIAAVDSSHFITGNHSILTLWDANQLRSVYSIYCDSLLTDLSDDGKLLAVPVNSNPSKTDGIEIREALTGDVRGVINDRKSGVFACRFSPSGNQLAVLYRNELAVYSLKDGSIASSINCPDGSFSANRLMWTSETTIMNNGILYDLQKGSILCHYLTLDSRTDAMTFHQGKVWIVFRSPDGFKLVSVDLPHKEVEEAYQKFDLDSVFYFYPEKPMKLTLMIDTESPDKRFPTLVSDWEKRLKQKGFNISQEANATLMLNLRSARRDEILEQFQKMEPHTKKTDYLVIEAMIQVKIEEGSNVLFKSVWSFRQVYLEQEWRSKLFFSYGVNANKKKEKSFAYLDWLSVPRYIGKKQRGMISAPIQVMYDTNGVNIVSH
ncbi:MAG: hypothetical protein Q4G59_04865 [Planctomycetia bacterium]|nr:hypothetical protein [Planctomycetia bacterium]